jgi:hypothetical protein
MWTGSALAQAPADSGHPSPQLMILSNDSLMPPAPAPAPAPALMDPSTAFSQPMQVSYQEPLIGQPTQSGGPTAPIDFFGLGAPAVFPWSANLPGDTPGGGAAQDFVRSRAGANYKTRVQASSSIAETHAPGHHRQRERAIRKQQAEELMKSFSNTASVPPAPAPPAAALGGASQASLQMQDGSGSKAPTPNFPFDLFAGLTFESSYSARAAVYEDTTRMAAVPNGGFLPSAIPVENQPFFGGPARTTVSGSGSSIGLQLNDTPAPDFNISAYTNLVVTNAESSTTGTPGVAIQQAFIQMSNLVVGLSETAFADNDALPPTLDTFGPNARVTIMEEMATSQGQGRLSYFLHQLPQNQAGVGYAINASVEQPIPEIITPTTPKPFTTFARFPDLIGTAKIGEMLEAPTDQPGDAPKVYYEAWHVQVGGLVRSLGLEESNNSIDESAFGWGVSLSGHYTFNFPDSCTILPDAIYGSVTYGVGIAHYIGDLHSQSSSTVGNDAVLDGTYLHSLPDVAYYAGYLHNWADHWRSLVCYSHVTLESQGQSLKTFGTLYRFGDYASANIEWHRLVNGTMPPNSTYDFNLGLEYIYGRFEELSGAAGQDQRISLVAAVNK